MVKHSFLAGAVALTISMASVVRAAELDVPPPPELKTTETTIVTCQKMGYVQGSEQFKNCMDTMKRQEDKLNEIRAPADPTDSGKNNAGKGNGRHHRRSGA